MFFLTVRRNENKSCSRAMFAAKTQARYWKGFNPWGNSLKHFSANR
jgi:hypothetical protein